jgi:L-threonylcarbamoyladenylate synthase
MMRKKVLEINQALITALQNGETILYPSDTIWGLGCDATNEAACQKILDIKNRPKEKSFIVLVDSIQMLEKYVPEFHPICYDLIDLSTAPLTIIYPCARGLAPSVLASDGSVGIRIPNDKHCLELIRKLKKPIVSTSANISGEKNPKNYTEINKEIIESVDSILFVKTDQIMDNPSQIIKIGLEGGVQVIRK